MGLKTTPLLAIFDAGHCGFADAENRSNVSVLSRHLANLQRLFFGQFGHCMFFAKHSGAVFFFVFGVLMRGSVSQVLQSVVMRISVEVAGFVPFWTRSFERQQNETVNRHLPVVSSNGHFQVSPGLRRPEQTTSSFLKLAVATSQGSVQRPNFPQTADFVMGVTGNLFPNFNHMYRVPHPNMTGQI